MSRYHFRGRLGYSTFIFIPLVIPEVVQGVSLLVFFLNVMHFQLGLRTLIIAHITFCISFVIVVVKARLANFDQRLEEAAADLGATPLQTFLRVILPLAAPGIAAGAVLAFTLSFDDVIISSFNAGVGSTTLPLYIYGQTKVGVAPTVNALSTCILAFTSTLLIVGMVASNRARRRGTSKGLDAGDVRRIAAETPPRSSGSYSWRLRRQHRPEDLGAAEPAGAAAPSRLRPRGWSSRA